MGLFNQFQTNKEKEQDGVEITYAANSDGSIPTFRVARMGRSNVKYKRALENITKPYRRLIEMDQLDNAKADELARSAFIRAILLGWENVQDAKGQNIVYSSDSAMKLFDMLPDLYDDLVSQASKAALFRDEQLESDSKN